MGGAPEMRALSTTEPSCSLAPDGIGVPFADAVGEAVPAAVPPSSVTTSSDVMGDGGMRPPSSASALPSQQANSPNSLSMPQHLITGDGPD